MRRKHSAKGRSDVPATALAKSYSHRVVRASRTISTKATQYQSLYYLLDIQPYIEFLVAVRGVRPELLVEQVLDPPELFRLSSLRLMARASQDEPIFL